MTQTAPTAAEIMGHLEKLPADAPNRLAVVAVEGRLSPEVQAELEQAAFEVRIQGDETRVYRGARKPEVGLTANEIKDLFLRAPQMPGAVFVSGARLEPQVIRELAATGYSVQRQDDGYYVVNDGDLQATTEAGDVIYKYPAPFDMGGMRRIQFPGPASCVHVGMQNGTIHLWMRIHKGEPQTRFFQIVGTGMRFPEVSQHVGSVQDGPYVWHVLERLDVLGVEVRDSSSTG